MDQRKALMFRTYHKLYDNYSIIQQNNKISSNVLKCINTLESTKVSSFTVSYVQKQTKSDYYSDKNLNADY